MTAFPKQLAQGLDLRLQTAVTSLTVNGDHFLVATEGGATFAAPHVVLAMALEQNARLLEGFDDEQARGARAVIGMFSSLPCLSLIAGYDLEAPEVPWDISYPRDSNCIMLISNESSKRPTPEHRVLVFQALPGWSREHQEEPAEAWQGALLTAAAARLGPWAGQPVFAHPHRWRYGRVDQSSELASSMVLRYPGDLRLGITGDLFAAGGGLQAAWQAGDHLAQRLAEGQKNE
jgi:predicted NAD/FAD-dependent oxidoreductase